NTFGGDNFWINPHECFSLASQLGRETFIHATASVVIFILLLSCSDRAFAQEKVRVGWAAMTASHTPLWVAQEKGLMTKHGLAPELIFFGAGPPAMQALVAGDLDIVVTSAPNVVNPRLGGADTVMILSIIPT